MISHKELTSEKHPPNNEQQPHDAKMLVKFRKTRVRAVSLSTLSKNVVEAVEWRSSRMVSKAN